jgi:N-acetylglucosaminyldiphosphoundecaprenol N-acetyl-beta-D-mannosaminyltransferase
MDLVGALCAEAERRGVAVFFLGCTEGVLQATRARLESEYPRLRIAGMHPPPFRALTAVEDRAVVEMINASGAGLVMVALGCPKQERWIHAHRGAVRAVMVGIGAALPVLAGLEGRAPAWMRRAGLEWLYRLGQNPRRLWKRYLVTNSLFIWKAMSLLAAERLRRRSPRRPPTSGQRG